MDQRYYVVKWTLTSFISLLLHSVPRLFANPELFEREDNDDEQEETEDSIQMGALWTSIKEADEAFKPFRYATSDLSNRI